MEEHGLEQIHSIESSLIRCLRIAKKAQYWKQVQTLSSLKLDRPAASILMLLSKKPQKFQELVDKLGIEAPSVSRKVHELEDSGLIIRKNSNDKRVHLLSTSPEGDLEAKKIYKAQCALLSEVISSWSISEREQFVVLFDKFATGLEHRFIK